MVRRYTAAVLATCVASAAVSMTIGASGQVRATTAPPQAAPLQVSPAFVRSTLNQYCVTCHNDKLRTGGFSLETLDTTKVVDAAPSWEKVIGRLRAGTMPPARLPSPGHPTLAAVAGWLETTIDTRAAANPAPGRPASHRLNRTEYSNAIRDLLAFDVDVRSLLPADDQGFGFDNNGDVLTMSPGLMERYMAVARRISRQAIGDRAARPVVETYQASRLLVQEDRVSEDLPFGSRGGLSVRHWFPLDAEYVFRVKPQGGTGRGPGEQIEIRIDGERVKLFTGGAPAPQADDAPAVGAFEARIPVKAGYRLIGITAAKRTTVPEGVGPSRLPVSSISFRASGIGGFEIDGPHNPQGPGDTPSRRRILSCTPTDARPSEETRCAQQILSGLARRAYRRPVNDKDVRTLLTFYDSGRRDGFEAGIRAALERVLIDPEFLFRIERDPAGQAAGQVASGAYRLSGLELASRLSFFLWSSIPDEELLAVAERGQLDEPAVLERQVRRMLADPRSGALVSNFVSQWLHLRNLRVAAPDGAQFPEFDDNLRAAFQRETELLFDDQIRNDRSVVDLLTANYTFVNERLARHYKIPNVYGSQFRRVSLENTPRAGLLGHGSVLTVTSYANRTSPVLRGKWLLENVLGTPPPAPPPDVPGFPEKAEGDPPRSVRARMEMHRQNAVCATCHSRIDPLGFALENFDAIGKWREVDDEGTAIDSSGALPDGTTIRGAADLRAVLLTHREEFVATVAEKLLMYAIGRGLDYHDRPTLRQIVRDARSGDFRWSTLVLEVTKSVPFQMRQRAESNASQ
jgi:Protein of unknown function (DUF1592)/Protein of unknown function (DUF1588)/Protein of unknown function (DUF1587)/Protein of unknown function (DUF1585)/Protein of unknown function (DUF1595)/Planctomycete cytochrome C